ncbi:MAG TPA: hypothetical protein PKB15_06155 [Acidimicrobiia bacterium]|nr:hypothetical protein [Acidimicrobiia bacterium]
MKSGKIHLLFILMILIAALFSAAIHANGWSAVGVMFCLAFPVLLYYVPLSIYVATRKTPFRYYRVTYVFAITALVSSFFIIGDDGDGDGAQYFLRKQYDRGELPTDLSIFGTTAWIILIITLVSVPVILHIHGVVSKNWRTKNNSVEDESE